MKGFLLITIRVERDGITDDDEPVTLDRMKRELAQLAARGDIRIDGGLWKPVYVVPVGKIVPEKQGMMF